MNIDKNISKNFHVLKFFAILMVFFGHFTGEFREDSGLDLFWVPVTVGLIIFSFSSGYFTAIKYTGNFGKKEYYFNKLKRLSPNLLVIYVILFFLFILQGQEGLWSWHTLVNILGLNGFLQWFSIENVSPYGKAMWFLTLLLIFYAVYPFMEKINRKYFAILSVLYILTAYILSLKVPYGHALWLTSCGFVCGVCAGKGVLFISPGLSTLLLLFLLSAMVLLNLFLNIVSFNFFLILFFSLCFIFMTYNIFLPRIIYKMCIYFSVSLLGIYLLHPYFLLNLTHILIVDFMLSVAVVLLLSVLVSQVSKKIALLFDRNIF